MTISVGDHLPEATLLQMGPDGAEAVSVLARTAGRKVVIFGLPGAFTGTCSTAHVPSFMRTKGAFDAKGVDEIICVSVNDPFVMSAWGEATGAVTAGLTFLADAESAFTSALGLAYDYPPDGFVKRSRRYALYAVDGVVTVLNLEPDHGMCAISEGEQLLAAI